MMSEVGGALLPQQIEQCGLADALYTDQHQLDTSVWLRILEDRLQIADDVHRLVLLAFNHRTNRLVQIAFGRVQVPQFAEQAHLGGQLANVLVLADVQHRQVGEVRDLARNRTQSVQTDVQVGEVRKDELVA